MIGSRFTRQAGLAVLVLAAAACGSEEKTTSTEFVPPPVTPEILSFAAEPGIIPVGGTTTLHWTTRNAVGIALRDANGTEIPLEGADLAKGSVVVQPAATTAYTFAATGPDATVGVATRTVTVTVKPASADAPTIEEFRTSAAVVPVGGEAVLSWKTTGATVVNVADDAGFQVPLAGAAPEAGEVAVRPTRSPTTYFLVAAGPGGRASAQVTVDVSGLPRISRFFVDPIAPVPVGGTVFVVWETANTDRVVIRQGTTTVVDSEEATGRQPVVLTDNATFSLEATGPAGTATAVAEARVGAAIEAFASSDRVVRADDPVEFTWRITGADRAVIDGPAGYHYPVPAADLASGSTTVHMDASGEFVLQAFRGEVPVSARIAVEVTEAPRIREVHVDRSQVTADRERPGTVTLSWTQDGADTCTIYSNNSLVPGYQNFPCGRTGTAEVRVIASSSIRLTAQNAAGFHSANIAVQAFAPAKIETFAQHPNRRLAPGENVELSWKVADAVEVALEKNGVPVAIDAGAFTGSTVEITDVESVYTLTARNVLGDATTADLTVFVGKPTILSAVAEPDFVGIGAAFHLSWTADGGDSLTITGPTGEVEFETTDPDLIDRGSARLLAPLVADEYTYTVVAENSLGAGLPVEVVVSVSDGPMIDSFTVTPDAASLGETVTFAWSVTNDPEGRTPTLTLKDDRGTSYPIDKADPNHGTLVIEPDAEREYVFTLTASTPNTVVATATVDLNITVPPFLHTFEASETVVYTHGGTVQPEVVLSWTSENAVEVTLWEKDAEGNLIPPAFHRVSVAEGDPQADLDAGSFTVRPTATTTYVARARNRVGSYDQEQLRVIVDPPEVTRFEVTPAEIPAGGTVTLNWDTTNADRVKIVPHPVIELGNTFVDISAAAGASQTQFADGDDVQTINFPAGFSFPWNGVNWNLIQVSTEGWAGFNPGNTSYNSAPQPFPTTSGYDELMFAPYWCTLDQTKNTPAGELWHGLATDAEGDYYVIQWKHFASNTAANNPADFNFELVLRPNGNFEYRYGTMTSAKPEIAAGSTCSIGYQTLGGNSSLPWGQLVPAKAAAEGGLQGKGFKIMVTAPTTGTVAVAPRETTTYQLTAYNADGVEDRAEDRAIVWFTPVFTDVRTNPTPPMAGEPFEITWTVENATRMKVLDASGAVQCNVTDPDHFPSGSCTVVRPAAGNASYTLVAENGTLHRPMATASRTLTVLTMPYLAIEAFDIDDEFVEAGQTVTLSWRTSGALEMDLLACPPRADRAQCTNITPAGARPASGTATYQVNYSTEFVLQAIDVVGRSTEKVIGAWIGAATLDSATASDTQIAAGEPVTLTWDSTGADLVEFDPPMLAQEMALPFIELDGNGGTQVHHDGTGTDSGFYEFNFPPGFRFPYYGTQVTQVQATVDGWLGFDQANTSNSISNTTLPSTTYKYIAMAPFWDDLEATTASKLLWKLFQPAEGPRYLVIEWKNHRIWNQASTSLDFEVVLWENGDFDFRYGAMVGTGTYEANANGSSASRAFQTPKQDFGYTIGNNIAQPGGLSHRAWRFRPTMQVDGDITVYPVETTTYEICATNASLYRACKEITVVVVRPGDLLITEAMIAPADPEAEWFEIRNLSAHAIDLAGFTVSAGTGEEFRLPAEVPVVVQPGAYAVFARSGDPAVNGGIVPDVVYGDALTLDDAADTLAISTGSLVVDSVTWDSAWTIPAGQAIAVEPTWTARDPASNDAPYLWCADAAGGSPGTDGTGCLVP
jgi:hypothetical protein